MADTILMDAGGVLFNNVTEETDFLDRLAHRYGANRDHLREELDSRDAAYETGRAHVHDVVRDALAASGASAEVRLDPAWLDDLYRDCVIARPGAFRALVQLRQHRPDLLLVLANNEAAHWDEIKNGLHGHLDHFDVVASSWRIGAVKPSADFFAAVARQCERPLDNAILIDDNPDVLDAARRLGLGTLPADTPSVLAEGISRLLESDRPRNEVAQWQENRSS